MKFKVILSNGAEIKFKAYDAGFTADGHLWWQSYEGQTKDKLVSLKTRVNGPDCVYVVGLVRLR